MSRQAKPAWRGGRRDNLNNRGYPDYSTSTGSLVLRCEIAALEIPGLAYQLARLIDLPSDLHHVAIGRLAIILSELNDRAAAAIDEVAR
jgi:hypothetical protein